MHVARYVCSCCKEDSKITKCKNSKYNLNIRDIIIMFPIPMYNVHINIVKWKKVCMSCLKLEHYNL